MLEGISAIFEKFPFAKWAAIVGGLLLFFGENNYQAIGLWICGGVAVFMLIIYFMVLEIEESDKEFRRRKNGRH